MAFTSFPPHAVPRMVPDAQPRPGTCLLSGCLEKQRKARPWSVALCESHISRTAPLAHHQPFGETEVSLLPIPAVAGSRLQTQTTEAKELLRNPQSKQASDSPGRRALFSKLFPESSKDWNKAGLCWLPPLQEFTFWACLNASYTLSRTQ